MRFPERDVRARAGSVTLLTSGGAFQTPSIRSRGLAAGETMACRARRATNWAFQSALDHGTRENMACTMQSSLLPQHCNSQVCNVGCLLDVLHDEDDAVRRLAAEALQEMAPRPCAGVGRLLPSSA
jgi:hypothetical protein